MSASRPTSANPIFVPGLEINFGLLVDKMTHSHDASSMCGLGGCVGVGGGKEGVSEEGRKVKTIGGCYSYLYEIQRE